MAGWAAVLVSHGQLPDSGCRSSSLHQKQRHSIEGRRTSPYPTHPQDTFSRLSAPQYRHAVTPPCGSPGMPRGRTSTAAAQANAVMRRHPDCSEGRRRLVSRSPHGHEQHARTTDATGREPRAPRYYGRYLVALYNGVRTHPPSLLPTVSRISGATEGVKVLSAATGEDGAAASPSGFDPSRDATRSRAPPDSLSCARSAGFLGAEPKGVSTVHFACVRLPHHSRRRKGELHCRRSSSLSPALCYFHVPAREQMILARANLAPAKRSIGVSGRVVARPVMVGVRTAHGGAWAFRRLSLDRAFTAIAVLPTFVVMLCIFGIPLLFSLYLSFTGWALDQALLGGRFVGLANYEDLLTDPVFVGSLGISFGYTTATV